MLKIFTSKVAFSIFIAICSIPFVISAQDAFAQQAESTLDEVNLCDVLTAHSSDTTRRAEGVLDEAIIPPLATSACEAAVELNATPLNNFQLGRAYLSVGRVPDSLRQFEAAADAGHIVAAGYTGDAYLFGRGAEKDLDKARKYYQIAVAGGFEQAQPMIDAITFDASVYMIPMVNGIYQGIGQISDPVNLAKNPLLNAYAFSFATSLNGSCDGAIKPDILLALMGLRYKGPITAEVESSGDFQVYTAAGDYDAQVFVKRHRCDGPVAEQLIRNLSAFIALNKPKSGDSPQ